MSAFKLFEYPMVIKEHHLDTFGHVNNATYLQLFEEARWELLQASGLGMESIHQMGVGPVVLEINIKFTKELRLRQSISIQSQMASFENRIGVMKQEIYNEQGELCCQAMMTFGFFDLAKRRLITPTAEWLQSIGVM